MVLPILFYLVKIGRKKSSTNDLITLVYGNILCDLVTGLVTAHSEVKKCSSVPCGKINC